MATYKTYTKRSPVSINKISNWRDVPWEILHRNVTEEQEVAIETARAENQQRYESFLEQKAIEKEALNPEGGSYEGNLSDEFPFRDVPKDKIFAIKRAISSKVTDTFVVEKRLKDFAMAMMPDLIKHLSSYKLSTISGEAYDPKLLQTPEFDEYGRVVPTEGQIDAAAYYRQVFTDSKMMGVYEFLMQDSRSNYIDKQYMSPGRSYCALVPLIMYAYKLHKGVPYSHWDQFRVRGIVNPKLYEAMNFTPAEPFTTDEIMSARSEGLIYKSGAKDGEVRNPVHTYKLYGATLFKGVPELAQTMLAQIWCAHPNNRTKYMVLDPVKWDAIPLPLINSEVTTTVSTSEYYKDYETDPTTGATVHKLHMPWD